MLICLDADQQDDNRLSPAVDKNSQSVVGILPSHSAQQLSSGGQVAQERRDKINYQYLMMAIPQQSDEKKRFSLGQRSNSGLCTDQQQSDSFLQDSWSTDKPCRPAPQRQPSSVTIEPGDLAADSKSLRRHPSHDYQNVSFDSDDDQSSLKSPDSNSLRFTRSTNPILQSANSIPESKDPFMCDSWAAHGSNTIARSDPSKAVPIATASDKSLVQSLPEYENIWNDKINDEIHDELNDHDHEAAAAPLQIDFGDLIEVIDSKQQQKHKQQHSNTQQDNSSNNHNGGDYHDCHKGPITVQSQPLQRSGSIVLSSGSHADPVSGDPDYENCGSDEDYANVFDTPSVSANQKKSYSAYDRLELKSPPPKSRTDTLSGQSFSLTGSSHADDDNGVHDESHELVKNGDNPFAGLVITASSITNNNHDCHQDLTRSMARSVIRRSNASYLDDGDRHSFWSSDRVEEEFSQVRTVVTMT